MLPVVCASLVVLSVGMVYASLTPASICMLFSSIAMYACLKIIPQAKELLVAGGLFGIDLNKKTYDSSKSKEENARHRIPESMGIIVGVVYLVCMFMFIPVPFMFNGYVKKMLEKNWLFSNVIQSPIFDVDSDFLPRSSDMNSTESFPHSKFVQFLSGLLSICCMVLLGFADDVLNLKWRHKLILPTVASLPLLMVYFVNGGVTHVMVPKFLHSVLNTTSIDLGILYYMYMGMLAIFCTNAINILAGVNGLEVGQSVVIGLSVIANDLIQLKGGYDYSRDNHLFSLYFMIPFVATSLALMYFNWYPSAVFVGDTYCYFAGMAFAVVAITGHFSKTMLLFFIPQVINFLYSVPQLFRLIPCPRHRLPRLNKSTNKLEMSKHQFYMQDLPGPGRLIVRVCYMFNLASVTFPEHKKNKVGVDWSGRKLLVEMNNLTVINFFLKVFGPLHEEVLCSYLLVFQVLCSCVALFIRYGLAQLIFEVVE
eukprot:Nk52_evm26s215 gene=Nk52_evmTU26s215